MNVGDNSVDSDALQSFVDRLEKLAEERDEISEDIRSVKKEVRDGGLDMKTLDKVLRLRKVDKDLRRAEREMLDSYLAALGM